jgi:hypothetical protein
VGWCLFFANRGEFRSGDAEEIMNKASCLSLLSNAVLVWNTLRIAEIVNQLRAAGHATADQDLARVSPLMHTHMIPNGTYRFAERDRSIYMPLRANGSRSGEGAARDRTRAKLSTLVAVPCEHGF